MIIDKVTKKYEDKTVLDRLTLNIGEGIYGLTGASGCGKTTLLRLIAGIEKADSGTIDPQGSVAMAFQDDRLFPWMTVLRNAAAASDENAAKKILSSLGLENEFGNYPKNLSGGMRKRVALATALAARRDILLLDEPFNGLDEGNIESVKAAIAGCKAKTIIISSHGIGDYGIDFTDIFDLTRTNQ